MDPLNNNFGSYGGAPTGGQMGGPVGSGMPMGSGMPNGANGAPQVISSGTGDVNIRSSAKKRRWPIVVGVLLLLVAVGLGVTAVIMGMPKDNSVAGLFNRYTELAVMGDGVTANNTEYIYAIAVGNNDNENEPGDVVRNYYEKLDSMKNDFEVAANGVVNAAMLAKYDVTYRVMKNAVNYGTVRNEMLAAYQNQGENGLMDYYNANIKCDESDEKLGKMCTAEIQYYGAVYELRKIFVDAKCYIDGFEDAECATKYYGTQEFLDKYNAVSGAETGLAVMTDGAALKKLNAAVVDINNEIRGVL